LHYAIKAGRRDVAEFLLAQGADPNDWAWDFGKDYYSPSSPLYMAVANNFPRIAEALLDHGADPDDGTTGVTTLYQAPAGARPAPLHVSMKMSEIGMVNLLLRRGARHDVRDQDGATPLHLAALQPDDAIVRVLIAANANLNARDNNGDTPYALAKKHLHLRTANLLRIRVSARLRYRLESAFAQLRSVLAR
jgi:ankyrin repeat protein